MDHVEIKKIYQLLHITSVLEKVDSDVDITQNFVESLLIQPTNPSHDFLNQEIYLHTSPMVTDKLTTFKRYRSVLKKAIEEYNSIPFTLLTSKSGGNPFWGRNSSTQGLITELIRKPKIDETRSLYRPQTSRSNLINIITNVINAEKELIDSLLSVLIDIQTREINNIKQWVYKSAIPYTTTERLPSINSQSPSRIPSITDRQSSITFRKPSITSRILPSIVQRLPSDKVTTEKTPINLPPIKTGGSVMQTLKTNCENFNTFFISNYTKLKKHVTLTNTIIKTRLQEEHESYGKLSLFGKLTFVETAFFRLLKYAIERILGFKEGRIDQIQEGFIGKFMYFFSLFSSFTGITLPPLLTVLGLTAIEVAIKTAIIVAGCKVLGILLATNVSIMILFYIKKAIDQRKIRAVNAIRSANPLEYESQPKVTGLMRLIRPNMTQLEYNDLKTKIKDFIFGVDDEDDQPEQNSTNESQKEKTFPDINVNDDEDGDTLKALILSTYNMISNTEDPIGEIKHDKMASPIISTSRELEIRDKNSIKIPENFNISILKKLTCSIVLNLNIEENDTAAFVKKINDISKTIQNMQELVKKPSQIGSSANDKRQDTQIYTQIETKIYNKLMTYKFNDLKRFYIYKTGIPINNYKKRDIVKKIIDFTKSN